MSQTAPSVSLYVGDLHPRTTEEELRETFGKVGTVSGVLVLKNMYNSKPLGYAYINFATTEDAQKALDQLNYTKFHGKPCRLMFSDRNPEKRKSGVGNLFVKNIHPDIDVARLRDVFSQFGAILSAKISTDEEGRSLGYGYVQFQDSLSAENALKELNGKEISARDDAEAKSVITVQKFIPATQRYKIVGGVKITTNTFYKNLPPTLTEEEFKKLVTADGKRELKAYRLTLKTEVGRKIAFADFATVEQAQEAVEEIQGQKIDEYEIYANFFQPKKIRARILEKNYYRTLSELKQASKDRNLWVGNLPQDYTDDQFMKLFAPFGKITSATIMKTPGGVSRQFGFVCFESTEEAKNAISNLNGKIPDQALQPLKICFFKPQKERIQLKKQEAAVRTYTGPMTRFNPHHAYRSGKARPGLPGARPTQEVYTKGARNVMPAVTSQEVPQVSVPPVAGSVSVTQPSVPAVETGAEPLDEKQRFIELLKNEDDEAARREALGDRLYPLVEAKNAELASKITGMILALEWEEIEKAYLDEDYLNDTVNEAVQILNSK
ncbi:hypothetical protein P9112_014136 [Eukaryota sp. TZLM1-RC]